MKDHKVIEVIKSFDKAACKRFKLFLDSPYHNPSDRVKGLGRYILNFYPLFNQPSFSEEGAFTSLGLESPFSKHELTRYLSKLFIVVEDFLANEKLRESALFKNSLVADFYFDQNNLNSFTKTQKLNSKLIKRDKQPESAIYFYDFLNKKRGYNFYIRQQDRKSAKKLLKETLLAFNDYHNIQVLTLGVTFLQLYKEKPGAEICPMLEPVLKHVEENLEYAPLLVKLWYMTFRMLESPTDLEYYQKLKQELRLHIRNIPPNNARNFILLLNAILPRYKFLRRQYYLEERFDNYLIEMQEGWLTFSNVIEYKNFNNIITIALALGRIEFAESFLVKYKDYLDQNTKKDILTFNGGHLDFHKGNFNKCLSAISQVSFLDNSLTLSIKRLQAMCFYELNEKEQFFNATNTMKVYIHRLDKNLTALKNGNSLFCKILFMLDKSPNRLILPKTKGAIQEIIDQNPFIPDAEWVQKILDQSEA